MELLVKTARSDISSRPRCTLVACVLARPRQCSCGKEFILCRSFVITFESADRTRPRPVYRGHLWGPVRPGVDMSGNIGTDTSLPHPVSGRTQAAWTEQKIHELFMTDMCMKLSANRLCSLCAIVRS